ncbi:MAG: hypothetical protein QXY49_05335 [Thermofilaceae archaeon]
MNEDSGNLVDCIERIKELLARFEEARFSQKSMAATKLARKLASPKSHGGDARIGLRVHNIWGDPYTVCSSQEVWTPLPLAYNFEGTWIYGVADLVRFRSSKPVEVVELKYFAESDKYSEIQVKVYAWLISKCFGCKPKAYLLLGWDGLNYKRKLKVEYKIHDIEKNIRKVLINNIHL